MEKILIYSHTGLTSKQIGLTTEIIENLAAEKNEIKIVLCDNVLHNCYFNRTHNVLACASCQSRQRALLKEAGIKDQSILTLKKFPTEAINYSNISSTESLMEYTFRGIDIGRGVASSIISYFRELEIDTLRHQFLIETELQKAILVTKNIESIFKEWNFDKLYIFNGRFAETWPVIKFAEINQIPFVTMEAGAHNRYELFENALPHSMKARHEKIENYWNSGDETNRSIIGNEWFTNRRGGIEKYEPSFIKNQKTQQLPKNFDHNKRNIVIFNSSEDEMASISEYQNENYKNQNEAILQIINKFSGNNDIHFYLRMHPNLSGVFNTQTKEIYNFQYPNLTVIKPEEKIDSYGMMDVCEKTITFGSSTGIEATYWKRPSILYGKAFYMYLDCVYQAKNQNELTQLIEDKYLVAKERSSTIPFGYFMMRFGTKPTHFNFVDLKSSTYKNKLIKKFYPSTISYILKYSANKSLWKKLHKAYYGKALSIKSLLDYK